MSDLLDKKKMDREKKRLWTQNARKNPLYRESERILRERKRMWLYNYKKSLSCEKCGYKENPSALHFHHLKDKKRGVADMVHNNCSIETIINEINKCAVLCANCHSIEHGRKL